jgi:hypothetical protein
VLQAQQVQQVAVVPEQVQVQVFEQQAAVVLPVRQVVVVLQ